jgi:hypothetical protein
MGVFPCLHKIFLVYFSSCVQYNNNDDNNNNNNNNNIFSLTCISRHILKCAGHFQVENLF